MPANPVSESAPGIPYAMKPRSARNWIANSTLPHAERAGYGCGRLRSRSRRAPRDVAGAGGTLRHPLCPRWRVGLAWCAAIATIVLAPLPSSAQEPGVDEPADDAPENESDAPAAIVFHETIEAARESATAPLPVIISFGADWCSWCRKLEHETFVDPAVAERGAEFLWVKVDIDENEELAARFRVRGVPHVAVLDGNDRLLAWQSGYMAPEDFLDFLRQALTNPLPEETQESLLARFVGEQSAAEDRDAVLSIVEQLAKADRAGRRELLAALVAKGAVAWPPLADLLADPRLAIRAAAAAALAQATGADVAFRPFDPAEIRAAAAAGWQAWLAERAPEALARHRAIPAAEDPLPLREDL